MLANMGKARYALLLICVVAFLAVAPMMLFGNPWGHDVNLHFSAWMETQQQFRAGVWYPQWTAGANYGFGQPFFIFYPPLSRMIGEALGLILPWKMVPGAYVWMVLVTAGMAMWRCASQWLEPSSALMASLVYAVSPYLMVTAYRRFACAELLASALFPLLAWAGIQMGHDVRKMVLPLAIVLAAIWLSDLPAAVIATYCVALLLVLMSYVQRSLRPMLYGALAIVGSFGSIAFFFLPAAWERRWVKIAEAVRPEVSPENNFLFSRYATMLSFNRRLSLIALLLVAAAACAAIVARRLRREAPDVWYSLVALGAASALMMFSPSWVLYRFLPEMRYVEFPWRWLSPLCVAVVLLISFCVEGGRRKWQMWTGVALAVAFLGAAMIHNVTWDARRQQLNDLAAAVQSGAGYTHLASWTDPLGSQPSKLSHTAPLIAASDAEDGSNFSASDLHARVDQWGPERKAFSVDAPRPLLLEIKLLSYPAWQARVDGNDVPVQTERESGQMLLPVAAGHRNIEIRFIRTWDRTVGIVISLFTVLALLFLQSFLRRRRDSTGGPLT
jgi:hypothetical protein